MPVRILHFIDTLGAGGTERQLVYLLENLNREHYESFVVTTYDHFRHYEPTLRALNIPLFSLHHGELTPRNRARALWHYVQLMRQLRPQIVHSWLHYPNLIASSAKPLCPPHRLITSVREILSPRAAQLESLLQGLSDFRIVNHTSAIHKNNFPTKPNTATIPNVIDLDLYRFDTPAPSRIIFHLLMPARIDPRKDHQTLIQALAQLPPDVRAQLRVTLIGQVTSPQTQAQIEQSIEDLKLSDIIQQLPPATDIRNFYASADVIILTSQSEGAPNVILEAFATGRPVIASTAANRANLVTHGITGWLFPTGDHQSLAKTIEQATRCSPAVLQQMGEQARREAEKYPISRMVDAYTEIYERLLSDA